MGLGHIPLFEDFTIYLAQAVLILFVIVNPVTGMAYYQGHTYLATQQQKKMILRRAVLVTMVVLWFFTFLGNVVLFLLRITVNYVRITGGVYILVYAVKSAIFGEEPQEATDDNLARPASGLPQREAEKIAIVPLAIPLLAGPGAIASVMILNQPLAGGIYCFEGNICVYGVLATALAVAIVSFSAWVLFSLSNKLVRKFNPSMLFTLGKVMDILMGAIAISFIIQGVAQTFKIAF